jgi:high-affinity Fe2+/Pb2+ permease
MENTETDINSLSVLAVTCGYIYRGLVSKEARQMKPLDTHTYFTVLLLMLTGFFIGYITEHKANKPNCQDKLQLGIYYCQSQGVPLEDCEEEFGTTYKGE